MACQVAHDLPDLSLACILLSYPLHPPGQPQQLRDVPLVQLRLPLLFVRGTRDEFSGGEEWDAVRARLAATRVEVRGRKGRWGDRPCCTARCTQAAGGR